MFSWWGLSDVAVGLRLSQDRPYSTPHWKSWCRRDVCHTFTSLLDQQRFHVLTEALFCRTRSKNNPHDQQTAVSNIKPRILSIQPWWWLLLPLSKLWKGQDFPPLISHQSYIIHWYCAHLLYHDLISQVSEFWPFWGGAYFSASQMTLHSSEASSTFTGS